MAKKTTTAKAKRSSKTHTEKRATKSKRSEQGQSNVANSEIEREHQSDQEALIEHYRGERTRGKHTGEAGSLEDETLDRDAPYNRTYGR
jgi:hypothetical protein